MVYRENHWSLLLDESEDINIYPYLGEFEDLNNTEQPLAIVNNSVGSITFSEGLNIADNTDKFDLLGYFIKIVCNAEKNMFIAYVDTDVLLFLREHNAVIQFFNTMSKLGLEGVTPDNYLDYIEINVVDRGIPVEDSTSYFNPSDVAYNPGTDVLSIPVAHFTEYQVSVKGASEADAGAEDGKDAAKKLNIYLIVGIAVAGLILSAVVLIVRCFCRR